VRFIRSSFYCGCGSGDRTRPIDVGRGRVRHGRIGQVRAGGGEQVAQIHQQRQHLFGLEDGGLHEQGGRSGGRQRRIGFHPLFDAGANVEHELLAQAQRASPHLVAGHFVVRHFVVRHFIAADLLDRAGRRGHDYRFIHRRTRRHTRVCADERPVRIVTRRLQRLGPLGLLAGRGRNWVPTRHRALHGTGEAARSIVWRLFPENIILTIIRLSRESSVFYIT
jgi:hypothetical protein